MRWTLAALFLVACGSNGAPSAVKGPDAGVVVTRAPAAPAAAPDAAPEAAPPVEDPAPATAADKKACDGGEVAACVRFAWDTEAGRGVPRDLAAAAALYKAACDKKDLDGCAHLGAMYEDGKGVKADTRQALALYTRSCEGGAGLGCLGLGTLEAMGQGVPVDAAKALTHFERSCAAGDPVGCLRAGRAYQRGVGVAASDAKATEIWAKLQKEMPPRCTAGEARACDVQGVVQHQGLGAPADVMAAQWILRACELGYARGCSEAAALTAMKANGQAAARQLVTTACDGGDDLGCALLGKLLVNSNQVPDALKLFEKACAGGGETGCVDLAGLYDAGGPVPQDQARATDYYGKACDGGSFRGCLGLGSRLASATGAKKDEKRARAAAEKACQIEPSACWMFARYLATGTGGAKDLEGAKKYYTASCAAGEETACPYKDNPLQGDGAQKPGTPAPAAPSAPDAGVSTAAPPATP